MLSLRDFIDGMELVWLLWLGGVCLLVAGAVRAVRHLRRPRLDIIHQDEAGASYTLSYVMVVPVYLLFICLVVETTLLLIAKVGTLYAAHAGARSSVVWKSMRPRDLQDDRIRQSIFTAMAPFASSDPRHLQGTVPPLTEQQAEEFAAAYKLYARGSEQLPAPRRPYARQNPSRGKLIRRYRCAASRTTYTIDYRQQPPDGPVTCTIVYRAPLHIPGAARILDPDGGAPYEYPIRSRVTLPNEAPNSFNGTLGIDYESR